jgi:hypothetical protein
MRLHLAADLRHVARQEACSGRDAGVVDGESDVLCDLGGGALGCGVGEVETHHLDPGEVDGLGSAREP